MRKIAALMVVLALSAGVAKAVPTATYNAATGNITFSELTSPSLLFIQSAAGAIVGANALPVGGVAPLQDDAPFGLTYQGPQGAGPFNGGNIVAPGTPLADLSLGYIQVFGAAGDPGLTKAGVVVPVPEPATVGLAGVALVGFVIRRRRA